MLSLMNQVLIQEVLRFVVFAGWLFGSFINIQPPGVLAADWTGDQHRSGTAGAWRRFSIQVLKICYCTLKYVLLHVNCIPIPE